MSYEEQLSAARFKAERDLARQEVKELREELEAMRPRLMPEGYEWPRFVDGEPVRFGDVGLDVHGKRRKCYGVKFTNAGFTFVLDDMGRAWWANDCGPLENPEIDPGKRVKRPVKVLDADGEEIRVGDTVWSTVGEFDGKRTVKSVHVDDEKLPYALFEDGRDPWSCLCCYLTHRATVIAADGRPLEVGQTVYGVENGTEYKVCDFDEGGPIVEYWSGGICAHGCASPTQLTHQRPVLDADGVPIKGGDTIYSDGYKEGLIVDGDQHDGSLIAHTRDGNHVVIWSPQHFTHTKPEIDTWERIEEDARKLAVDYWGCFYFDCDDCPAEVDGERPSERFGTSSCSYAQQIDLVRRAKALAERGE